MVLGYFRFCGSARSGSDLQLDPKHRPFAEKIGLCWHQRSPHSSLLCGTQPTKKGVLRLENALVAFKCDLQAYAASCGVGLSAVNAPRRPHRRRKFPRSIALTHSSAAIAERSGTDAWLD